MRDCWMSDPGDRPTFDEIIDRMDEILDPPTRHTSVQEDEGVDDDYYNLFVNVEAGDF